jgi:O-antigen/teichoic acid export membrane protein
MNFNLFRSSKTAALCLIAPVYAILPTCVLLLALYALGQLAIPLWLHTYCWVEVAFAVYYYYLAKKSQALTGPFHRDPEEVVYLFKRSLAFGLPVEHEDRATHVLESNSEAVTTFR